MPRRPRLELPGIPLHVTQRGVNRCAVFLDEDDRTHYLRLLGRACRASLVAVHAFVLMDNHLHLMLSSPRPGAISRVMRAAGQAYVQAFNHRHGRSGTLWQGRFKSCLVDTEDYLLAVLRYIELNPVRAAMAAAPEDYRWSSVHAHLARAAEPLHTPHPVYLALGSDPQERACAYREWLRAGIQPEELQAIRRHVAQERALGNPRFQAMVEKALGRPAACRSLGRPRKENAAT